MEGPVVREAVRTEIVVRGRFGPALSKSLGAYFDQVLVGPLHTRLVTEIVDQPALLGFLDLLAGLHLHIVSVNPVDDALTDAACACEGDAKPTEWLPLY